MGLAGVLNAKRSKSVFMGEELPSQQLASYPKGTVSQLSW